MAHVRPHEFRDGNNIVIGKNPNEHYNGNNIPFSKHPNELYNKNNIVGSTDFDSGFHLYESPKPTNSLFDSGIQPYPYNIKFAGSSPNVVNNNFQPANRLISGSGQQNLRSDSNEDFSAGISGVWNNVSGAINK